MVGHIGVVEFWSGHECRDGEGSSASPTATKVARNHANILNTRIHAFQALLHLFNGVLSWIHEDNRVPLTGRRQQSPNLDMRRVVQCESRQISLASHRAYWCGGAIPCRPAQVLRVAIKFRLLTWPQPRPGRLIPLENAFR